MGRFRPSIQQETEEEFTDFIDNHPELPVRDAKELMLFATRKLILEVEHGDDMENISPERINEYAEQLI
jgi:hypothetical protein